ncbi:MAG: hypothetical protein WC527_04285 [Candidatus Margulisiibacteriota bacterium]
MSTVRNLHGPLSSVLYNWVRSTGGTCSISVDDKKSPGLVLNVDGKPLGALRDPLCIATSMKKKHVEQVTLGKDDGVVEYTNPFYPIEMALTSVLTKRFDRVQTDNGYVYRLEGASVDRAKRGLPALGGIDFVFTPMTVIRDLEEEMPYLFTADDIFEAASPLLSSDLKGVLTHLFRKAHRSLNPLTIAANPDFPFQVWGAISKMGLPNGQAELLTDICTSAQALCDKDVALAVKCWNFAYGIATTPGSSQGNRIYVRSRMVRAINSSSSHSALQVFKVMSDSDHVWQVDSLDRLAHLSNIVTSADVIIEAARALFDKGENVFPIVMTAARRMMGPERAIQLYQFIADNCQIKLMRRDSINEMVTAPDSLIDELPVDTKNVRRALTLWSDIFGYMRDKDGGGFVCAHITKKLLYAEARTIAVQILEENTQQLFDADFRTLCLAKIYNSRREFEKTTALLEGFSVMDQPLILLAGAEALRGQRMYEQANMIATAVIEAENMPPMLIVEALCCRGFCSLHLTRPDRSNFQSALEDFDHAIITARRELTLAPKRAYKGRAIALEAIHPEKPLPQEIPDVDDDSDQ